MSYNCPECHRAIYNRRLTHCGFCGAPIPDKLRFTSEEIAKLDREAAELEEQHRQRQRAADKEETEARQRQANDAAGHFFGLP
jgi:hypothetical protein